MLSPMEVEVERVGVGILAAAEVVVVVMMTAAKMILPSSHGKVLFFLKVIFI